MLSFLFTNRASVANVARAHRREVRLAGLDPMKLHLSQSEPPRKPPAWGDHPVVMTRVKIAALKARLSRVVGK
jgi:hypothetical protein